MNWVPPGSAYRNQCRKQVTAGARGQVLQLPFRDPGWHRAQSSQLTGQGPTALGSSPDCPEDTPNAGKPALEGGDRSEEVSLGLGTKGAAHAPARDVPMIVNSQPFTLKVANVRSRICSPKRDIVATFVCATNAVFESSQKCRAHCSQPSSQ